MRRILRDEAVCLRVRDYKESSKLVVLFTRSRGRITGVAKGARRPRSRFGAALDIFARSRVIYYWRENRDLFTLSDVELISAHSSLAASPAGFLAAERMAEFVLRTAPVLDPNPSLYNLLVANLDALAAAPESGPTLVASFLLKAASFLGFRPELRRCLVCRKPVADSAAVFDHGRGGLICPGCAGDAAGTEQLSADDIASLSRLLLTPAPAVANGNGAHLLDLVVRFVTRHFEPITLNSLR